MKNCPIAFFFTALILALILPFFTQPAGAAEFRAYWVDAWSPGFKTAAQVDQLMADVRASNCNAVFCQMRRRGDTYYPSPYEPFASDANPGFDALAYLIQQAHGGSPRIEVHAWMVVLPVASAVPSDPNHPYNKYPQYLTKNYNGNTFDGSNYWFDPGHPGALQYLYNVLMDVVSRYDVDGIHLDYIRFPSGGDWGYNDTSVARFNARYGLTGKPAPGLDVWQNWRRDQVTALVRKVYANAIAIKPNVKVSAATITWGNAPGDFNSSSAYTSVFQNWKAWMDEGILDINVPMCYYTESQYPSYYDNWIRMAKDLRYDRHVVIGQGSGQNTIADTIAQLREARLPGSASGPAEGMAIYCYDATNNEGQPRSVFINALTHPSSYDPNPTPIFNTPVSVPAMPWKTTPTKGHLKGAVTAGGGWVDGAQVSISGPENRNMVADGTGFYAFIDLTPGTYTVTVTANPFGILSGQAIITAGSVTTKDFDYPVNAPVISNVQVTNITSSSFTVTWTTDIQSTSQVLYGTSRALGSATPLDTAKVTSHSVTVTGLSGLTPYYFQCKSTNDSSPAPGYSPIYCRVTAAQMDFIVDNPEGTAYPDAEWNTGSAWDNYGTNFRYTNTNPGGTRTFTWRPNLPYSGNYTVYVWYPMSGSRSPAAPFTVYYDGGSLTETVNQQIDGRNWENNGNPTNVRLGTTSGLPFAAGTSGYVQLKNDAAGGYFVAADAVKFHYIQTDTTPPSVPINLQVSNVQMDRLTLTWNASSDASGVAGYKIFRRGFSETPPGQQIAASATTSFQDEGLIANKQYIYCLQAYDVFGNTSGTSSTVSVWTLSTPPSPATVTADKMAGSWMSTPDVTFTAVGGYGEGKVAYYSCAWNQSPVHSWTGGEYTWLSATITQYASPSSGGWYFHVKGWNASGIENGTMTLGPYYYDDSAPGIPVVDDGVYQPGQTQFTASWVAADLESGIKGYRYAVGTSPGGTDLVDWTDTAFTSETVTVPARPFGTKCYFTVKAQNNAGIWGGAGNSDGVTAAHPVSSIAEARALPDDEPVSFTAEKPVIAAFADYLYIEEPDRSAGLRVEAAGGVQGTLATVGGVLGLIDGERTLRFGEVITGSPTILPEPIMMNNRELGGAGDGNNPGVTDGIGLYNFGLLVRTTGRVSSPGTGHFYLNDGSNCPVKVYSSRAVSDGDYVAVTGISAAESGFPGIVRVIRTRSEDDVQPLP